MDVEEATRVILQAMTAAETAGTPAAKAALTAKRQLRLSTVGYNAIIRHLWSRRLITAVKVPQPLGAPDTLVPDGVTDLGIAYIASTPPAAETTP